MLSNPKIKKEEVILIDQDTETSSDPEKQIAKVQTKSKKRKGMKKVAYKKSAHAKVKIKRKLSSDDIPENNYEALVSLEETSTTAKEIQETPKQKQLITPDHRKKDKGMGVVLIEDLKEELKQVKSEERKLSQENILIQKARRWLDVIANEESQSKPKEEKIKVMCESFIDLGKLAEELIETVEKATSSRTVKEDNLAYIEKGSEDESKRK